MTAREVITEFRDSFPCPFADDQLIRWISELEWTLCREVVTTHLGAGARAEGFAGITLTRGADEPLAIAEPYSKVYGDYIRMKCDLATADSARYAVSSQIFSSSWRDCCDAYNRDHAPKKRARELKTGGNRE